MGRRWTEDEDIYLEYFVYGNDGKIHEAADFLGRSVGAVHARLYILRQNDTTVSMTNRRWTISEQEYLKRHHSAMSVRNMARRLRRSESSVAWRLNMLGLTKTKSIEMYDAEIRNLAENGYYLSQVVRALGIRKSSLVSYAKRNRIEFRKATGEEMIAALKEKINKEWK